MSARGETAQIAGGQSGPVGEIALGAILAKRREIAAIGADRVFRQSPLEPDVVQERVNLPLRPGPHQELSGDTAAATMALTRPRNSVLLAR